MTQYLNSRWQHHNRSQVEQMIICNPSWFAGPLQSALAVLPLKLATIKLYSLHVVTREGRESAAIFLPVSGTVTVSARKSSQKPCSLDPSKQECPGGSGCVVLIGTCLPLLAAAKSGVALAGLVFAALVTLFCSLFKSIRNSSLVTALPFPVHALIPSTFIHTMSFQSVCGGGGIFLSSF